MKRNPFSFLSVHSFRDFVHAKKLLKEVDEGIMYKTCRLNNSSENYANILRQTLPKLYTHSVSVNLSDFAKYTHTHDDKHIPHLHLCKISRVSDQNGIHVSRQYISVEIYHSSPKPLIW